MTDEEAINILKQDIDISFQRLIDDDFLNEEDIKHIKAYEMAIEALKGKKVGKWKAKDFHTVFCSGCEFEVDIMVTPDNLLEHLNHCPNCGARMEGQE